MENELQVTDVQAWKKSSGTIGQTVALPSGNVAVIRTPGMEALLRTGTIPNGLMEIIQSQLEAAKGNPQKEIDPAEALSKLMDDPDRLVDILELVDTITCAAFISPKVWPMPSAESDRDEEKLYVDEVDIDDKFYIFGVAVGGTKDLERFREELAGSMELVQSSAEVENPSE